MDHIGKLFLMDYSRTMLLTWMLIIFIHIHHNVLANTHTPCPSPKAKTNTIIKADCGSAIHFTAQNSTGVKSFQTSCIIKVQCTTGLSYKDKNYIESICFNGAWYPPIPSCQRFCPSLKPVNVNLQCFVGPAEIPCTGPLISGTRVTMACKLKYRTSSIVDSNRIICRSDGQWSRPLFTCVPDCGVRKEKITALINNGYEEQLGGSPWQVAIYSKEKKYLLICGGTIVSQRAVLSAAHCFYNTETMKLENENNYVVVAGKISRDFYKIDSNFQQTFEIEKIKYIADEYSGLSNYYLADISVLILKKNVQFNDFVLPACVDWGSTEFIPIGNENGIVSGWGLTEIEEQPATLLTTKVQYLSRKQCLKTVPADDRNLISTDKFCVKRNSSTDSTVQKGDSGGGLLFLHTHHSVYYLRGIVSANVLPSSINIGIFTDISKYISWISEAVDGENSENSTDLIDQPAIVPTNERTTISIEKSTTKELSKETNPGSSYVEDILKNEKKTENDWMTITEDENLAEEDVNKHPRRSVKETRVELGSWPWIVALGHTTISSEELKYKYAGILISDQWVLTAAACLRKNSYRVLKSVLVGELHLDDKVNDRASPQDIPVDKIIIHLQYNNDLPPSNNIGLIKLKYPVTFRRKLLSICILQGDAYKKGDFYVKKSALIAGWGSYWNDPPVYHLREVTVTIFSTNECKNNYTDLKYFNIDRIDEKVLCAGAGIDGKNTCVSDPGGPLVLTIDGIHYLAGIRSFRDIDCSSKFPAVYTKVAQYAEWINSQISEN